MVNCNCNLIKISICIVYLVELVVDVATPEISGRWSSDPGHFLGASIRSVVVNVIARKTASTVRRVVREQAT